MGRVIRPNVADDDLLIVALRILLPSYDGPPMTLYRGQMPDEPIGLHWSRSWDVARKFALFGINNVDPYKPARARHRPR